MDILFYCKYPSFIFLHKIYKTYVDIYLNGVSKNKKKREA